MLPGSSVRMSRLICVISNDGSTVINTKCHVLSRLGLSPISRQWQCFPDILSGYFVCPLLIFFSFPLFVLGFFFVCLRSNLSSVSWHLPYRAFFPQQHSCFSVINSHLSCLFVEDQNISTASLMENNSGLKMVDRSSFWTAKRAQNIVFAAKQGGKSLAMVNCLRKFTKVTQVLLCHGCWTGNANCMQNYCASGTTWPLLCFCFSRVRSL